MVTNTVTIVSSFGPSGERLYGRKFLDGFLRCWPKEIQLLLYTEAPCPVEDSRIIQYDLFTESLVCRKFIQRNNPNPEASGRKILPGQRWKRAERNNRYAFRYDAIKFCRKVFTIADAVNKLVEQQNCGRLFWVDADVETFATVPLPVFNVLLPPTYDISYLGRIDYHSECGFIWYNLQSPLARAFVSRLAAVYASDSVFALPEWHDSWVFDWVRGQMPEVRGYSIPSGRSRSAPFDNCALGRYARHLKGDRKRNPPSPMEPNPVVTRRRGVYAAR